ncbi:MAG: conjugative transposon protein TraM [Bacteroidota bacterium]|nr:conjugative transposon protein TraM [Bacteroidota bacterium]
MKLNLKQPKYILPLLALPFLVLFFYVYHSSSQAKQTEVKQQSGINSTVGEVSDDIKQKELSDKLDAYRNTYKEADGNTALSPVPVEAPPPPGHNTLDSIKAAMKSKPGPPDDRAMVAALNHLKQKMPDEPAPPKEKDPMDIFRRQMAYMDSLNKSNDPAVKEEQKKKEAIAKAAAQKAGGKTLPVHKTMDNAADFNTIKPPNNNSFITAVIDENLTGYAGSRIRIRLLEDIVAGSTIVKAGTYLYALINGFSQQRVTLQVKSILYNNKILPVKLDLYDMDGMPGLYVPESAFRDFTKDLGTNTVQGVTIDGNSSFLMSTVDKVFQSTSSAIAGIIRKDKAKLKYNSYIYLIDSELLNTIQKNL